MQLQIHSNDAQSTVAAQLLAGGTTLVVNTGEGVRFRDVFSPQFELLTLTRASDSAKEIVRVTAHDGGGGSPNDFTITRAQEGTTALQFEIGDLVEALWTAGEADRILSLEPIPTPPGEGGNPDPGTDSLTIQPAGTGRSAAANIASGLRAIAIGRNSRASGQDSLAIGGLGTQVTAGFSVAICTGVDLPYGNCIAIGNTASIGGAFSIALGPYTAVGGARSVAIGISAGIYDSAYGVAIGDTAGTGPSSPYATALGASSGAIGARATALGFQSETNADDMVNIAGWIANRRADVSALSYPLVARRFGGVEVVVTSGVVNLKSTGNTDITLPSGCAMYVNEVGVIVLPDVDTVTGQPSVSFGFGSGGTQILGATACAGLTASRARQIFDRGTAAAINEVGGSNVVGASVTTAATGTTVNGRFYWKGLLVQDA